MKIVLAVAVLALAGCASSSGPNNKVWDKPSAGPNDFGMDQGQCQAQATQIPGGAALQMALVFNACMRGKGWQLVDASPVSGYPVCKMVGGEVVCK